MSETENTEAQAAEAELAKQTQHVQETALQNLGIVIDQLESLGDNQPIDVLEALDTAKTDLEKLVHGSA
jgi:hypothetical protein